MAAGFYLVDILQAAQRKQPLGEEHSSDMKMLMVPGYDLVQSCHVVTGDSKPRKKELPASGHTAW